MQFNPTDKSVSLIGEIDFLLWSDSSTLNTDFSLVDRTRAINNELDEVVAELHKADPNYKWDDTSNADFPFATLDLTANQDHYTLLDSALVIHRVRIKDQAGNLRTLDAKLLSEFTDDQLASTGTPEGYYKIGQAVFPVPVPDYGATDGVELSFQRGANHFASIATTDEPGFNPQFHRILSVGAALQYAIANGFTKKVNQLRNEKNMLMEKMRTHYERRSPDDRTRLRLKRSMKNYGL